MKPFSEKELQQYIKEELIVYLMKIQPHLPSYTESIKEVCFASKKFIKMQRKV